MINFRRFIACSIVFIIGQVAVGVGMASGDVVVTGIGFLISGGSFMWYILYLWGKPELSDIVDLEQLRRLNDVVLDFQARWDELNSIVPTGSESLRSRIDSLESSSSEEYARSEQLLRKLKEHTRFILDFQLSLGQGIFQTTLLGQLPVIGQQDLAECFSVSKTEGLGDFYFQPLRIWGTRFLYDLFASRSSPWNTTH